MGTDVPDVAILDISATGGAFDADNDPYNNYADRILAQLRGTLQGDVVALRPEFVTIVRGWRQTNVALERALRIREGVSQRETNAFLNAQTKVTAFVRKHMSDSDWFVDNPVPPSVRAQIDGVLKRRFGEIALGLKDAMNLMRERQATTQEQMLIDTVGAVGEGAAAVEADGDDDFELEAAEYRARVRSALTQARSIARTYVAGIFGFVPLVGDGIDVCEAFTGKEACDDRAPSTISLFERVASGLGVVLGSGKFWRGASLALSGAAATVVQTIAKRADELADLAHADRALLRSRVGVEAR